MIRIQNPNELAAHLNSYHKNRWGDFFIALGIVRSSKSIRLLEGNIHRKRRFLILNEIDGSTQNLTEEQLYTDSNIGEAMQKKCFFSTDDIETLKQS